MAEVAFGIRNYQAMKIRLEEQMSEGKTLQGNRSFDSR